MHVALLCYVLVMHDLHVYIPKCLPACWCLACTLATSDSRLCELYAWYMRAVTLADCLYALYTRCDTQLDCATRKTPSYIAAAYVLLNTNPQNLHPVARRFCLIISVVVVVQCHGCCTVAAAHVLHITHICTPCLATVG